MDANDKHFLLANELNVAIARAEAEVAQFGEKLQSNPMSAFESYGARAVTAAAVIAVYRESLAVITAQGHGLDLDQYAQSLTVQLVGQQAHEPRYQSGMLSLPMTIEKMKAMATLAALIHDILAQ
jgi:hypothetical protein